MGTIPAKELLSKWKQEDLPVEMAIGHLLQHVVQMEAGFSSAKLNERKLQIELSQIVIELKTIKTEQRQLQTDINQVLQHLGLESQPPKRPRGRPPKKE
ncbi:hypothetical protein QUF64_04900 [Anaerolineales bacterium HSG6]|nr:hypothetical protein [Anaerolineales bacterium HSG6]MDM8529537.1 hypothetical protein [Anaerolineales bacterium HSG25]